MSSPGLPNRAGTPFNPSERPGIIAALKMGSTATLQPTCDATPYTQRDLNEMVDRDWATRFRQRPYDKAWTWVLTREGRSVAAEGFET